MVVVLKEPEESARNRKVEKRMRRVADEEDTSRHADGGDERKTARKAVQSVNQVEGVDGARDPEDRQHAVQPPRQFRPEVSEPEVRPKPGEEGNDKLPKEFQLRRQGKLVVRQSEQGDGNGQGNHLEGCGIRHTKHHRPSGCQQKASIRKNKSEDNREAAAARNRHRVDAPRIGLVDHAKLAVQFAYNRCQDQRGDQRPEEDGQIRQEFSDHLITSFSFVRKSLSVRSSAVDA